METKTLKSQNCGAPLKVSESQKHIVCHYCGVTNIVFEELLVKETPDNVQAQKARSLTVIVLTAVVALIGAVVAVFAILLFH